MNNYLNHRTSIFGKLGDFWTRQISKDDVYGQKLAMWLANMSEYTKSIADADGIVQVLSGHNTTIQNNISLKFDKNKITVLNVDLQARLITQAQDLGSGEVLWSIAKKNQYPIPTAPELELTDVDEQLTVELDDFIIYPYLTELTTPFSLEDARLKYIVSIPENIYPIVIRAKEEDLVVGLSFRAGNGFLIFEEDPIKLFNDNTIIVKSAEIENINIHKYTLKADALKTPGYYVTDYYRNTQSPKALQLALAEIAGIPIISEDSILKTKTKLINGTIVYEFENQILHVPASIEHTELEITTFYEAHTILGDYIQVTNVADANFSWFQSLNWVNGLSLDNICPIAGLTVPNAIIKIDTVEATGGQNHYRPHIQGDAADLTTYWGLIKNAEIQTGNFLEDVLPAPHPGTKYVHGLGFYFQHILSPAALIIDLKTADLGTTIHNSVLAFISREMPITAIPIIRDARQLEVYL